MRSLSMKNLFMAALLGLLCGTLGETLLFMEAQTRRIEEALCADFRVVTFLDSELPEAERRTVEDRLRELPGTAGVRFVSRDESLTAMRHQDPEMMRSVALLGENPLLSAFEVALEPEAVPRASDWAESASRIQEIGDIRFKPMEVQAIVQAQFFVRFLRLALSLSGFFWLAGAAAGLSAALSAREGRAILESLGSRLAMAGLGTAAGMGLVLVAALPLRSAPAAWAGPAPAAQGLLFLSGLLGALFAWDWGRGTKGASTDGGRAEREPAPRADAEAAHGTAQSEARAPRADAEAAHGTAPSEARAPRADAPREVAPSEARGTARRP